MRKIEVFEKAETALRSCLDRVPFLKVREVRVQPILQRRRPDFLVTVEASEGEWNLVVEAKAFGQPLPARAAIDQLRAHCQLVTNCYPVLLAPYISDSTAQLCEQEGVGYVDLAGNCRLCFGQVYIEQRGRKNPYSERRELRSLYSPKSERVLRVLLTDPRKSWLVQELANVADVSLGLVSKAKRILENREWIEASQPGFRVSDPWSLLQEWAREYRFDRHAVFNYYSIHSVNELEALIETEGERNSIKIALTGFSAAARLAPAVRYRRAMAYVDGDAVAFGKRIDLKQVDSGANVTLIEPYDDGVFFGSRMHEESTVVCPIQIYLDLMSQRARGEEAAEALLREVIRPAW